VKTKQSIYPAGATNANWFSAFNALSFQITLGSPIILYVKSIGATATILGIVAALPPLMMICQIPAAHFLAKVGYRRFIFSGWGLRTVCIFLISAVPLMGFLGNLNKLVLILFALFLFNLLRGISSGAWLPWLTDLIPEDVRGRFLSRDQIFLHAGCLVSLGLGAVLLYGGAGSWQFSLLFFISALAAVVSLLFLRKTPDVDARDVVSRSGMRVPWRDILFHPPFLRLVVFTLLFVLALGAGGVFGVAFMKSRLGFTDSQIMFFGVFYFLGALLSLPFAGKILDRTGSKMAIEHTMISFCLLQFAWWMLSAGLLPPSASLIIALHFIGGIVGSNFSLAFTRLMMNTMPPMGRSHFFALYSVISSLGAAIAPLFWGMMIDSLDHLDYSLGPVHFGKYSVFYLASLVMTCVTLALAFTLQEKEHPGGRITVRELLYTANLKRISRFWQR